jgi:hypothetical protein
VNVTASSGFTPVNSGHSDQPSAAKKPRLEENAMDVDQQYTSVVIEDSISSRLQEQRVPSTRIHISESPQPLVIPLCQLQPQGHPEDDMEQDHHEHEPDLSLIEPQLPIQRHTPVASSSGPPLYQQPNNRSDGPRYEQHVNGRPPMDGQQYDVPVQTPGQDLIAFAQSLGKLSELLLGAATELEPESVGDLEEEIHHDWRVEEMATFVEGFVKGAKRRGGRKW